MRSLAHYQQKACTMPALFIDLNVLIFDGFKNAFPANVIFISFHYDTYAPLVSTDVLCPKTWLRPWSVVVWEDAFRNHSWRSAIGFHKKGLGDAANRFLFRPCLQIALLPPGGFLLGVFPMSWSLPSFWVSNCPSFSALSLRCFSHDWLPWWD